MKSLPRLACVLVLVALAHAEDKKALGPVLAIGGGKLGDAIVDRIVALAGEKPIVVCPAASEKVEGPEVARFQERGAKQVLVVDFRTREQADDPERCTAIEKAGAVFFTGGDQSRLLDRLAGSKALAALKAAHARGALIAGTSAGCAVLGEVAITGDGKPDRIEAGVTPTVAGFGFVEGVVFDQHFLARRRHNRLVSTLLEKKTLRGIGVDEDVALLIREGQLEVVGRGVVSVYVPHEKGFALELLLGK